MYKRKSQLFSYFFSSTHSVICNIKSHMFNYFSKQYNKYNILSLNQAFTNN